MGEANSYTVQQTEETSPTLEESAQLIDEQAQEQAEIEAQPKTYDPSEVQEERPEWLPEKFGSAEEMAKAYGELETKLGQPKQEEEEVAEEASTDVNYETAINAASEEYSEKGELSEETYASLQGQGLSKLMVDNYIAGQQAIINQQQMEITNEIGGMDEYQKLSTWAAETLSDSDLEAYNQTVESGTVAQAKFAIKSLYSQFQAAGSPRLAQGSVNGTGVPPFQSRQQVTAAMRNPAYENDPAYREEVLQRLARSNV